ncbi:Hypothetical predicted protein [Cloeon dipterum]|uniref:Innexin n=1 Tax=Cloeon dipterum TaxID=197152 RepID=A0A8S1DM13_9INSE|nr:Hypothetical predicted protein [Cloeon dipterum]
MSDHSRSGLNVMAKEALKAVVTLREQHGMNLGGIEILHSSINKILGAFVEALQERIANVDPESAAVFKQAAREYILNEPLKQISSEHRVMSCLKLYCGFIEPVPVKQGIDFRPTYGDKNESLGAFDMNAVIIPIEKQLEMLLQYEEIRSLILNSGGRKSEDDVIRSAYDGSLESPEGVQMKIDAFGGNVTLHGTLVSVNGDGLAMNSLGGFKGIGFSYKPCRNCDLSRDEMGKIFYETRLRDFVTHRERVNKILDENRTKDEKAELSKQFGINGRSVLEDLKHFDLTKALPQDAMHNLLEGVAEVELRALIFELVEQKRLLTYDHLNHLLAGFPYSKDFMRSKPSPIEPAHIKNVPLMLAEFVKDESAIPFLENFSLLGKITNIILAYEVKRSDLSLCRLMINCHHTRYKELYPNFPPTPKFHFLVHTPSVIELLGPAILFYAPRWLWKSWEGGKIHALMMDLDVGICSEVEKKQKKKLLLDYLWDNLKNHNWWAYRYYLCELLALLNVVGQMFLMNKFFDGAFLTFGFDVIAFLDRDQEDRIDPMIFIFPRMTKCTFHKFGTSGEVERHDAVCILPLNVVNEKIYVFLWFWFLILGGLTALVVLYRCIVIVSPRMRVYLLRLRFRLIRGEVLDILVRKSKLGDWFLISMLGENVDSLIFRDGEIRLMYDLVPSHHPCLHVRVTRRSICK